MIQKRRLPTLPLVRLYDMTHFGSPIIVKVHNLVVSFKDGRKCMLVGPDLVVITCRYRPDIPGQWCETAYVLLLMFNGLVKLHLNGDSN